MFVIPFEFKLVESSVRQVIHIIDGGTGVHVDCGILN